jgi:hypothetical protein
MAVDSRPGLDGFYLVEEGKRERPGELAPPLFVLNQIKGEVSTVRICCNSTSILPKFETIQTNY